MRGLIGYNCRALMERLCACEYGPFEDRAAINNRLHCCQRLLTTRELRAGTSFGFNDAQIYGLGCELSLASCVEPDHHSSQVSANRAV